MTFPTFAADADPDPTTQIAWPAARPKPAHQVPQENSPRLEIEQRDSNGTGDAHSLDDNAKQGKPTQPGRPYLSTWDLITLSISMGGAQVAWTVELGCA
jgi:solute carrier family 45 protein 1/2/4